MLLSQPDRRARVRSGLPPPWLAQEEVAEAVTCLDGRTGVEGMAEPLVIAADR